MSKRPPPRPASASPFPPPRGGGRGSQSEVRDTPGTEISDVSQSLAFIYVVAPLLLIYSLSPAAFYLRLHSAVLKGVWNKVDVNDNKLNF